MQLDTEIFLFLNSLAGQNQIIDAVIIFFAEYFQYFVIAGFLLFLFFSRRPTREKIFAFLTAAFSSVLARFFVAEIIRYFYHRPRPFLSHEASQLLFKNSCSFPSGHAIFFFALAMAVYFFNKKIGALFFLAGFLISLSRIIAGVHYPSDVIGGLFLGAATACIIFICAKIILYEKIK